MKADQLVERPISTTANPQAWFRVLKPNPHASQRIICLPHAGGSASFFRTWVRAIPASVELVAIQYPGREERIEEPCIEDMTTLVNALEHNLALLPQLLQKPYVFFGHSMGAAVAYELCLKLQRQQRRLPTHLVVSASEGPGCVKPTEFYKASDADLLEEIVRLNENLAHLRLSAELQAIVMPVLRGDYRLIESYARQTPHWQTVDTRIVAMLGTEDTELTREEAQVWAQVSAHKFNIHSFSGGHFYPSEQAGAIIEVLMGLLQGQGGAIYPWPSVP